MTSKPKIANLEREQVKADLVRDWAKLRPSALLALLRLARAAKDYSDAMLWANDEDDHEIKVHLEDEAERRWDDMNAALDAFDWEDA